MPKDCILHQHRAKSGDGLTGEKNRDLFLPVRVYSVIQVEIFQSPTQVLSFGEGMSLPPEQVFGHRIVDVYLPA